MPSLKDLTCTIDLPHPSQPPQPLSEYNTTYSDGLVETCIPIPRQPTSFSIHVTLTKFIAPGIAIFVYIDGVYQCNRNRQGLRPEDKKALVEFRLRQKEEREREGWVARGWGFDGWNEDESCAPDTLDKDRGCIEVVVLRCAGSRDVPPPSMNLDGAGDWSDCYLDSDGGSKKSHKLAGYDDRGLEIHRGFGATTSSPYRAPYAESLRSQEDSDYRTHYARDKASRASTAQHGSRYSRAMSPHTWRADDLPPEGFQYGSGPVPSEREGSRRRKHSNAGLERNGVDPVWLNKLLKTAVKQGVEESRRVEAQSTQHDEDSTHESERQDVTSSTPGAWPGSPISEPKASYRKSKHISSTRRSDGDASHWDQSQAAWSQHKTKRKARTHVNCDIVPAWETETSSGDNGWHSNDETPSESWDTDETWETSKKEEWKDQSASVGLCPSTSPPRPGPSRVGLSTHSRSKASKASYPNRAKGEAWMNDASSSSSNDTVHPSRFQSHPQTPRHRSKGSTRPSNHTRAHHFQHSSNHTASWQAKSSSTPSSITTHVTPVIVNAPATRSKNSNSRVDKKVSALQVPAWIAAVNDTMKKQTGSPSIRPPAPYAEAWVRGGKYEGSRWREEGKELASGWDEGEKDTISVWDEGVKDTWDESEGKDGVTTCTESEKNSPAISGKKSRSTSSSTRDTTKPSTWDADPDTTWTSTPKPSPKTTWASTPKLSTWTAAPPPPPPFAPPSLLKKDPSKRRKEATHTRTPSVVEKKLPQPNKDGSSLPPPPPPQQPKQPPIPAPIPPFSTFSFPPPPPAPCPSPTPPQSHPQPAISHTSAAPKTAIRTKEAVEYGHVVARPEYLDSLERPYAVFRFRCRREGVV